MFPANTKILIVDDMMMMRAVVQRSLNEMGFTEITQAENGESAWDKITFALNANAPFQLIICDIIMPGISGIELLIKVRATPSLKGVPFVMLTAEGEKAQILKAIQAGVSSYIVKPFTTEILKEKLQSVHAKMASAA